MKREEATKFARKAFADRGVIVKEFLCENEKDVYFTISGSCHVRVADGNNFIHFHSDLANGWEEALPKDPPPVRIRHMTVNGVDIPESECYPA